MSQGGLPPNISVSSFEELELKEPTPSIAASLYESAQYSRKWRVAIALLVGGVLIGLCLVGFYVNAESRRAEYRVATDGDEGVAVTRRPVEKKDAADDVTPHVKKTIEKPSAASRSDGEAGGSAGWRSLPGSCEYIDLQCPAGYKPPILLLVGIDGVRNDMITSTTAPALHHLSRCGVMAHHLTPVYPTNTFSNLYTIVTGLYPESHGIIGPVIHDAQRNKTFRVGKYESYKPYWWAGEPIWNTVQNKGLQSAMYYWPGSYVQVGGRYPTYWYKYRNDYPLETAVNKIQEWLLLEQEERPSFLGLYFDNPDKVAQEAGAYSKLANDSLLEVDHQVDRLMTVLHDRNLSSCVDIIVVSDHGTAPSSCGNSLYLETFMPDIDEKARVVTGSVGRLQAIEGKGTNAEILNQLRCKNPKLRALSKDLLPNRYHYANNQHIEDVILDTLPGNRIVTSDTNYCKKAEQGFNNIETSMQGVFFARGPSFKTNYKTAGFRNVEIYNLLNLLLGATPAPNNGTEGSLYHILRVPPPPPTISINEWHENVLPFLHPRSRDQSYLEELQMPVTELTTTTPATPLTTTPTTTTTIPDGVELSSPAVAEPVVPESPVVGSPSLESAGAPTTAASATPASAAPTPAQGDEAEPLALPEGTVAQANTEPSASATSTPAVLAVTVASNTPGEVVPVVDMHVPQAENSASAREAKTVAQSEATLRQESLVDDGINVSGVLPVPVVLMSSNKKENRSIDFSTDLSSSDGINDPPNNSTIAIERKIQNSTQIVADVVEVATSDPISLKHETMSTLAAGNITTSTSAEPGVDSISSTLAPLVTSSTSAAATSTSTATASTSAATASTSAATASNLSTTPQPKASPDALNGATASPTTPSSLTPPATTTQEAQLTTPPTQQTTSPPPEEPHLPAESSAASRRKRKTCECSSTQILQTERSRGQTARSDHITLHCPFGVPLFEAREAPKGTHYILPFTNHVNGYIGELGTALWTSFTLTNSSLATLENTSFDAHHSTSEPPCWLADPRLPRDPQQQCLEYLTDRYNTGVVTMHQLFPQEFESPEVLAREGFFLTNAIALRKGFLGGGRGSIGRLLRQWTALRNVVNVISGPVWDRNLNGRGDTIIHIRSRVDYLTPSHMFYIVSSCKKSSGLDMDDPDLSKCSSDELDVLAFVFPNTNLDDDCLMSDADYCRYHLTSVTDIERLTGLQVFSTFTGESALPALLAQQPLLLWDD